MISSRFDIKALAHGFLALGAVALPAAPAFAEAGADSAATVALAADARPAQGAQGGPIRQSAGEATTPARVTVSRAADLVGRVTYPSNSRFADTASLVAFSPRPPVAGRRIASLPSQMPLAGAPMTSGFGMRRHPLSGDWRAHSGVDLAAPAGSPVLATSDGSVSAAGWSGGYGLLIALEHGDGVQTRYAHLSRLNVTVGQQVREGDVIGFVGSTGRSTGPHLHYETRLDGRAVNPPFSE